MPIKIRRLRTQMSISRWMNKQVWYMHTVIDFIWQPAMTSSVVGQRSSKALPKAQLASMKRHGHWLVVHYPSDPLHFSETWWNHCIWEVCSANWWDALKTVTPAASIGQQKRPDSSRQCSSTHHTTNASKVEQIGLQSIAISAIFIWPLANRLSLLQAPQQIFAGKNASTTSIKHGFLCYRNKQTYCLLAKMCQL